MNENHDQAALAERSFLQLHGWLEAAQFKGYEFDDFLASPLVHGLTFGNLFLRRVAIQVGEKLPINIRPLIGVPKLDSTKARGFFARGYLEFYRTTGERRWLELAERHLAWLLDNPSSGCAGISWGNAFPFASRGGYFPQGLPTVVWTSHIAEVFLLAHELTGKPQYAEVLPKAAEFAFEELPRHEDAHGICMGYAPGLLNLIHNSNLLGAATLLRAASTNGNQAWANLAKSAYSWSLAGMHDNGSWAYGPVPKYAWVDNFHTAYVLDCLMIGHKVGGESVVPWTAIQRTYEFWVESFFEDDGTAKYFPDEAYPLDIQCASQAIETLARVEPEFPGSLELAGRVMAWTVDRFQKRNGAFRYQYRRLWRNNLESIHWGQATMLSALGTYLRCKHEATEPSS